MTAPVSTISFAGIVGPGQTLPIALSGTMFYLSVATGPLYVRPSGQVWSEYQPGTGLNVSQGFTMLEVQNAGANAVTFQIFAGSSAFIDRRILPNVQTPSVMNVLAASASLNWQTITLFTTYWMPVPDLSGQSFQDESGTMWLALQRQSLTIHVTEMGSILSLCLPGSGAPPTDGSGQIVSESPSSANPFPMLVIPCIGSFRLLITQPAGPLVSAAAFEIYTAVLQGFQGTPPS